MRKIFLIAALTAATATPSVSRSFILAGIESSDNLDHVEYYYNDMHRLTEIRRYDVRQPMSNHIIVIEYDDEGREIRNTLYQDREERGTDNVEDYRKCYYIEYSYGDGGLLSERVNYNNIASGMATPQWVMGGVMAYEYDTEGRPTWVNTYFDKEKKDIFQTLEYVYEDGTLVRTTTRTRGISGEMEESAVDEFSYTEDGLMRRNELWRQNFTTGELEHTGAIEFSYDGEGNPVSKVTYGPGGSSTAKNTWDYSEDAVPATEVVFPYENEESDDNRLWSMFRKKPLSFDDYGFNDMTGGLSYMVTYTYVYDSITGVAAPQESRLSAGVSVATFIDGVLVLDGVESGSLVRVFASDGSHVCDRVYTRRGISLETLAPGVYYISAGNGAVKVRR